MTKADFILTMIFLTILLIVGLIIGFFYLRDHLSNNNVSWLKAKYSVVPYHDNIHYNFNGKVSSFDEYYIIRRKVPFFFCTRYVRCTCRNEIDFCDSCNATQYKSESAAKQKLRDMIENPDNYTMSE